MICYTNKHKIPFQIDDEDLEFVKERTWHCDSNGYIGTHVNRRTKKLHQLIFPVLDGMIIDHINGDKKDNRKANLRGCNHSQNAMNQKGHGGTSKYKGVHWHKKSGVWQSAIKHKGKTVYLGDFQSEEMAALTYNEYAIKFYGEFAKLNIVDNHSNAFSNVHTRKKTSKYKGVGWHKSQKRWNVVLRENGKNKHLGSFVSEEEAASVYNEYVLEHPIKKTRTREVINGEEM